MILAVWVWFVQREAYTSVSQWIGIWRIVFGCLLDPLTLLVMLLSPLNTIFCCKEWVFDDLGTLLWIQLKSLNILNTRWVILFINIIGINSQFNVFITTVPRFETFNVRCSVSYGLVCIQVAKLISFAHIRWAIHQVFVPQLAKRLEKRLPPWAAISCLYRVTCFLIWYTRTLHKNFMLVGASCGVADKSCSFITTVPFLVAMIFIWTGSLLSPSH